MNSPVTRLTEGITPRVALGSQVELQLTVLP